ncbi:MAG TPA: Chromate resistance protein ChrB, partial [Terriglobales bacterium]|nr:Chromate resistance protein ChrB [Terriglobales bacterium]
MSVTKQKTPEPPWLLLVFSLARKGASLRVTVWRKLQRYGALPLGNSGYFLPNTAENRERFEWLATAVRTEGGEASVLEVQSVDNCSFPQMKQRFSEARAGDYRELLKDLRKSPTSSNLSSRITRLRQRFQDIVSIDFFGNPLREQVERALNAMQTSKTKSLTPEIGSITPAEYRNRVWVTRPRPGVDRVTSAWLIRKFIDPKAKFAFAPED